MFSIRHVLSFLLLCSLLVARPAAAQNGLSFFNNYFVTGDVVVSGVGLKGAGTGGFATRDIVVPALPANATPIAAFLYWGTVVPNVSSPAGMVGAQFKGNSLNSPVITKLLNPTGTSPCWSSGGGTGESQGAKRFFLFRADVLRFFDLDSNGRPIVAGNHTVRLAESGSGGNQTPFTLGASLVIIYRAPGDAGQSTPGGRAVRRRIHVGQRHRQRATGREGLLPSLDGGPVSTADDDRGRWPVQFH